MFIIFKNQVSESLFLVYSKHSKSLCYDDLKNYFKINFSLMQHHKYSLTELENMIPWERDIYVAMLIQYLEEENQKLKERMRK